MNLKEFGAYRQKTAIGASVVVVAPLGHYCRLPIFVGTGIMSLRGGGEFPMSGTKV